MVPRTRRAARSPFTITIPVAFRDLDAFGHVNNAVYLAYFETARVAHLMRLTGARRLHDLGIIVARATCDFRSPAIYGETLIIGVRVTHLGTRSFTYGYEVREQRSGRLVAEGETVQVTYDAQRQQSAPMPARLRRKLERLLEPGPGTSKR
jgi:acyl-CoA thioester hydrolase